MKTAGHYKLTPADVENVLHLYRAKILSQRQLAKRFKVSQSTIRRVVSPSAKETSKETR